MSDLVYTSNNLLLTRNNLISFCCCGSTPGEYYWEGVHCDAYSTIDEYCTNTSDCVFDSRKFVNVNSICDNGDTEVCECQKLVFRDWHNLTKTNPDAAQWCIGSDTDSGTATFNVTGIQLSARRVSTSITYAANFLYSNYSDVNTLALAVNAFNPIGAYFPFSLDVTNLSPSGFSAAFEDGSYSNNTSSTCVNVEVKDPGLYLTWNGQTTPYIEWNENSTLFKETLQNRLRTITDLADIVVEESDVNSDASSPPGIADFYIIFSGSQCGVAQPEISMTHHLFTLESYNNIATAPYLRYGTYIAGWGSEGSTNYNLVPEFNTHCPYEDSSYTNSSGCQGYAAFDETVQCCPQKGLSLGPRQLVLDQTCYGSDFEHLENTVILSSGDGECYKINPFFFIFGKEGRFYDDEVVPGTVMIRPDCNYHTSGACTNNSLPCNCVPELFVGSFNYRLPWGPFGSYHSTIETQYHNAYLSGLFGFNKMADNAYQGVDYAPTGFIKTMGTWTETTGIIVDFLYYRMVPFYVGTEDANFDDHVIGLVDATSVTGGLSIASGNTGVGTTTLVFNTSGKSIQNFIDAVNSVVTTDNVSSASTGVNQCQVFNICGAASTSCLDNIPASRINNLSTELFDVWKQLGSNDETYAIANPENDVYGYSAAPIWPAPRPYDDMLIDSCLLCGSRTCSSFPNAWNSLVAGKNRYMPPPPPCRRTNNPQDYTGGYDFVYRNNFKPFWISMQGCNEDIALLSRHTASGFDPLADNLYVTVSGRFFNIIATTGNVVIASTGISIDKLGAPYQVSGFIQEINNAKLFASGVTASGYYPVFATGFAGTTGIYLDNSTWWDGSLPTAYGVGSRTPHNWAYIENVNQLPSGSLWNGNITLDSWIRDRCDGATDTSDCSQNGQLRCVPSDAIYTDPPVRINCDGDNVIEDNWLSVYGCESYNCKTEWFIRAERCGCNTVPVCNGDGPPVYIDHPLNREIYNGCQTLTQPTLYVCESNIHPQCDIPFLVKVPYQLVCISGQTDCYFGDCYYDPDDWPFCVSRCPKDTDLPEDDLQVRYAVNGFCGFDNNCLLDDGYNGWCQFIDPENNTKVRRQEIPRTWPPRSFILERTSTPFCTTYINPFDEEAFPGCIGPPSVPKYDAIGPIWPHVPLEFLISEDTSHDGWPCMLDHLSSNILYAYIRPAVSPLELDEFCDFPGSCGHARSDIDCNTRCCGCGFACSAGCPSSGPERNTWHLETATYEVTYDGYTQCCFERPSGLEGPGSCNYGPGCDCANAPQIPCYDGTISRTTTINFSKNVTSTLIGGYTTDESGNCDSVQVWGGCCWGADGTIEDIGNYGGCGTTCFYQCCAPAIDRRCGPEGFCDYNNTTVLSCLNETTEWYQNVACATGFTTDYYCALTDICTTTCGGTSIIGSYIDTLFDRCSTDSRNSCGVGSLTYDSTTEEVLTGVGRETDCNGNPVELGLFFAGGGINNGSCTCSSWDGSYAYHGGTLETITYSGNIGADTGSSCDFNGTLTAKTYSYISNKEIRWECALANTFTIDASGSEYVIS